MIDLIVCASHLSQAPMLDHEIEYAQELGLDIKSEMEDRYENELDLTEEEIPKYTAKLEKRINDSIVYWNTNPVDGMLLWNDHLHVVTYKGDPSGIGSGSFNGCKGLPREFINSVLRELDIYYKSTGVRNVTLYILFLDIFIKGTPMMVIDSSWYKQEENYYGSK